jgi:hypothetical protein
MADVISQDRVRYVFVDHVFKVEEKQFNVGGKKLVNGEAELFVQSGGWWLTLCNLMSIHIGNDQPTLKVGDKVRITIEKI